ncbi:MAG: ABC transporter permease [Bdellovibrionaceae bacterium]|nr:ABC transporter permease [Pseudobdellovibrionaceae bacterium]MBX3032613.1 ABC transporter permease [Pseudobdellovibrionaceae bacterium]
MSSRAFWRRNLGFFNMAISANVEYRLNYVIDAVVQPSMTAVIELLLWLALFQGAAGGTIGGFTLPYYLSYALWGAFFARIASSWMYEFRMIEEIESGSVNGLLVRPFSFYEYYFSQLMGYKFITTFVSFLIPLGATLLLDWPAQMDRLPLATLLVFYYLILVHSISFLVSCCAFFWNRIHSFTVAKNLAFWILTGELVPLDLMPEPYRGWVINLPFASGVYVPVAYLTGRAEVSMVWNGFLSVTVGLIAVNAAGALLWKKGLRSYVGTGA